VSTTLPRYSAPDRSRQRVRLIAALGLLAATAIGVGGLVHLLSKSSASPSPSTPTHEVEPSRRSEASTSASATPTPRAGFDSLETLVGEVEQAERAVSSARAALRRARVLGGVDADQLDWLERRLDALGPSPTTPSAEAPASPSASQREL